MDLEVFLSDIFNGLITGDPIVLLIATVAVAVIGYVGYVIYWDSRYRYVLSEEKEDNGVVVDMDYIRSRNTRIGKTSHYTSEKHNVYIMVENADDICLDHERLYQTVRLGDDVKIKYRDVTRVRKDNPRDIVFIEKYIVSITSPKGYEVKV